MAATPWGIAAVGIGLLVAGVMQLIDAYDEVMKTVKQAQEEVSKETDRELDSMRKKTEELQKHKHLTQEIAAQQIVSAERNTLNKYLKDVDSQILDMQRDAMSPEAQKALTELNQKRANTQSQLDLINKGKDGKSIYDMLKTPSLKPGKISNAVDDKTKADNVTEPKHTIINININKLVEAFNLVTQNLGETAAVTKEQITKALISGVEDAQIIGGG